jgi:hypothetical protein
MRPTIFQIENGFNVITKQETELDGISYWPGDT